MAKKKTSVSQKTREDITKRLDSIIDVLEGKKPKRTFDSFDILIAYVLKASLKKPGLRQRFIDLFVEK
jgi:sulfur relay (sulfurtransferase) DsrF/TusC family protein